MYPFFVDYNGVANKVDMVGVNIQCQKIGEMVPDRSLYLVVSKKVCKFSLSLYFIHYSFFCSQNLY